MTRDASATAIVIMPGGCWPSCSTPPGRPAVVLALPRGGVPVAAPIAERWALPLAVLAVRKLGAPGRRELAMGAVAAIGDRVELFRNESIVRQLGVNEQRPSPPSGIGRSSRARRASVPLRPATPELTRPSRDRGRRRAGHRRDHAGRRPAAATHSRRPASPWPCRSPPARPSPCCRAHARVICPRTPEPFIAVGQAYDDFEPGQRRRGPQPRHRPPVNPAPCRPVTSSALWTACRCRCDGSRRLASNGPRSFLQASAGFPLRMPFPAM